MANRILISLGEDVTEPVWFNKVEPFIQTVLQKLNYDNEEISVLLERIFLFWLFIVVLL